MEHLIKELSETNAVLLKLVSHLGASPSSIGPSSSQPMASSGDSQLQYSDYFDSRATPTAPAGSTDFTSYNGNGTHLTSHHRPQHNQNTHSSRVEAQEGQDQTEFVESAVRQLMQDPSFAASLAQQLNAVRDDRTRMGDSFTSNNDSVYEQVLESDAVGSILDQLIPSYQAATPAGEDTYTEDGYSNDSRAAQTPLTPHPPQTPRTPHPPNASSSTGHVADDFQLMYPEMASFDAEESNAGISFTGFGHSTAIPMSFYEQHPNGRELLQSQPNGAGSAPVLTSLARNTSASSSLLGSSTRLPGINFKTVPSSRPKTPNASNTYEAPKSTSPPQKNKKRLGSSPEALYPKKKKDR